MIAPASKFCGHCGGQLGDSGFCAVCGVFTATRRSRSLRKWMLSVAAALIVIAVAAGFLLLRTPARNAANQSYSLQFFSAAHGGVTTSASVVVPLVTGLVHPQSVVDFGCGIGEWLLEFKKSGVPQVHGVDGPWVSKDQLLIDASDFEAVDLEKQQPSARQADLAMSLEVVEHLKPETAAKLVQTLTATAPVILFSAAIPGQGGTDHINEQWPSYWHRMFEARGYVPLDVIRPKIQNDPKVEFYYRQNIVLYCSKQHLARLHFSPERSPVLDNSYGLEWVHASRSDPRLVAFESPWRYFKFGVRTWLLPPR
jgi:hypothetical protein